MEKKAKSPLQIVTDMFSAWAKRQTDPYWQHEEIIHQIHVLSLAPVENIKTLHKESGCSFQDLFYFAARYGKLPILEDARMIGYTSLHYWERHQTMLGKL